ncbi:hypothetical protein EAF04_002086 [Stromatinia cepivora]|nr:hypothetical protein EAF04_002086 [Stromatinia cepivora]
MLCQNCQYLFEGSTANVEPLASMNCQVLRRTQNAKSFSVLSDPVGCILCHKIWQWFLSKNKGKTLPSSYLFKSEIRVTSRGIRWIDTEIFDVVDVEERLGRAIIELRILDDDLAKKVTPYSDMLIAQHNTNSEDALKLASSWIQECLFTHKSCRQNARECTKMPTRLLELDQPHPGHVRLQSVLSTQKYMTLSHCWGCSKPLRLLKETFEQLQKGIPTSSLPKTFSDTVKVVRTLGIRYLWIDSLCIFQDSLDDWKREAYSMCDVYRGSFCNIAATASEGSEGGLFRSRDPRLVSPLVITTEYTDYENKTLLGEFTYFSDIVHDHDQPLLHRGWVVQEPSNKYHSLSNPILNNKRSISASKSNNRI